MNNTQLSLVMGLFVLSTGSSRCRLVTFALGRRTADYYLRSSMSGREPGAGTGSGKVCTQLVIVHHTFQINCTLYRTVSVNVTHIQLLRRSATLVAVREPHTAPRPTHPAVGPNVCQVRLIK
jgi:hypothetical protein